jgi:hypothetical protein
MFNLCFDIEIAFIHYPIFIKSTLCGTPFLLEYTEVGLRTILINCMAKIVDLTGWGLQLDETLARRGRMEYISWKNVEHIQHDAD